MNNKKKKIENDMNKYYEVEELLTVILFGKNNYYCFDQISDVQEITKGNKVALKFKSAINHPYIQELKTEKRIKAIYVEKAIYYVSDTELTMETSYRKCKMKVAKIIDTIDSDRTGKHEFVLIGKYLD